MKVAIIGYGGMGREVEKVLLDRGHEVSARVDPAQKGADAKELTEKIARRIATWPSSSRTRTRCWTTRGPTRGSG